MKNNAIRMEVKYIGYAELKVLHSSFFILYFGNAVILHS